VVLPIIVGALIVTALVGGAYALNWGRLRRAFFGKGIAVLGARGVGKTTLRTFLSTGTIPEKYVVTDIGVKSEGRTFQLRDLELSIKDGRDVGGDKQLYGLWKKSVLASDIVLLLVRSDKLFERDPTVEKRALADAQQISRWLEKKSEEPDVYLVGTHLDLVSDSISVEERRDHFRKLSSVSRIARQLRIDGSRIVLGSLVSKDETAALVHQLFTLALEVQ